MNPTDYPVFLVYSKEDGAWLARVDLLPGCVVDGATPKEALANTQAAIALWIETATALGRPVPPPLDAQGMEDAHLKVMEQQGQQIQALLQDAVVNAVRQFQSHVRTLPAGGDRQMPNETYLFPVARTTDYTAA